MQLSFRLGSTCSSPSAALPFFHVADSIRTLLHRFLPVRIFLFLFSCYVATALCQPTWYSSSRVREASLVVCPIFDVVRDENK